MRTVKIYAIPIMHGPNSVKLTDKTHISEPRASGKIDENVTQTIF